MKRIGFIAAQRIKSIKGQHIAWDTEDSDKTIRLNSRTYTVAASIIGMQSKPRAGVAMTDNIYGAEFEPGINAGYTGVSIIGVASRPQPKNGTGNLSGDIKCFEAVLEQGGTRTIAGTASCLHATNNMDKLPTGGVYVIHVPAAGGGAGGDWSGFAKLVDDGGAIADLASAVGTVNGVIKVKIGTTTCYIPTYATYTPS